MKRSLYSFLSACSLALPGCGSDEPIASMPAPTTTPAPPPAPTPTPTTPPPTYQPGTHPRFDPAASDLPFNTDLVFRTEPGGDGTANLGAPTDPVRAAVNQLDGFSTSAFFDVLISAGVDGATVTASSVLLVEVDSGGKDALSAANTVGVKGLASYDVKVVSLDGGTNNVIRIRPTKPLAAKTKYLVALTSDLKDVAGSSLTRSLAYDTLRKASSPIPATLTPVRTAIQGWETLASKHIAAVSGGQLTEAAAREKLVLTYTFTTTDPVSPLVAMASPRAAIAQMQIQSGTAPATALANAVALESSGVLPTPKQRAVDVSGASAIDLSILSNALAAGVGKLYTGYIKLPYYQTAAGLPFGDYLKKSWKPDLALAAAMSTTVPADVDGSFNVTYRFPFAAKTGDESVPLQITMPQDTWVPGYAGAANCGQVYASTGYPTVIFVHGVGSDRTSVLALAHLLASRCVATVAIDLPLHGIAANSAFVNALNVEKSASISFASLYGADAPHERHFNVAGPAGAPAPMSFVSPTAADGSGNHFIDLGSLTPTRDNHRQAVVDLLNLNASLAGANAKMLESVAVGLDLDRIFVAGASYGGILASVFATVNQLAIAKDAEVQLASSLRPIRGLVASTAGTQIAQILTTSATFAPAINAALATSGSAVGTSNYERSIYAAQSAMDSCDPVSFMEPLAALGIPVLVQQVNGDPVIPNSAPGAPLAGTRAMATLLNASHLGLGGSQQLGRGWVKLTAGGNDSLLRTEGGAPQVTAELQAQLVTLVLTNDKVTVGGGAPGNIELP